MLSFHTGAVTHPLTTIARSPRLHRRRNMIKFGQQSAVTGLVLITEMLLSSKVGPVRGDHLFSMFILTLSSSLVLCLTLLSSTLRLQYLSGEIAPLSEMDRGWATFWIITLSSTVVFIGVSAVRYILKNMRPSTQNGTEATKLKAR